MLERLIKNEMNIMNPHFSRSSAKKVKSRLATMRICQKWKSFTYKLDTSEHCNKRSGSALHLTLPLMNRGTLRPPVWNVIILIICTWFSKFSGTLQIAHAVADGFFNVAGPGIFRV
jgi:hypothetical protein